MAEVINTAVYKIRADFSQLPNDLKKADGIVLKSINSASNDITDVASNSGAKIKKTVSSVSAVSTTLVSKATSKITSLISSNIDSAVKRVDTLNAFPKMMELFGISSEEAARSIDRISERLKGLPTSLNQGASAVQNLFMVTKDLGVAESLFYAINDAAMVFANGSTDAIDGFIYAYKQSLSMGKVQAEEFNQMNEAIPGLMDKVAEAMGLSFIDLKSGLSDGTLSIESFNGALQTLDTEGVGAMSSLQEGAKNATGGIATTMENMETAIGRGIGKVIEAIGEENIIGTINVIGTSLESVGKAIGGVINFVKENEWVWPIIIGALTTIGIILMTTLIPAIWATTTALLANPFTWIALAIGVLIGVIAALIMNFDKVKEVVGAVFGWIGNFIGGVVENIKGFFQGAWEFITGIFSGIGDFFGGVFEAAFNIIKGVFEGIVGFFGGIWDTIVGIFGGIGTAIGDAVSGAFKFVVNGILAFVENFINGPINLINGAISGINAVLGVVGINIGKLPTVSLPRMYTGGIVPAVSGGMPIIAGDGGEDEWVVPESKMASLVEQLENRGNLDSGNTYNIYVEGVFATSATERRKVADQIVEAINQNNRRRFAQ